MSVCFDVINEQLITKFKLIDPVNHSQADQARIRELVYKYSKLNQKTLDVLELRQSDPQIFKGDIDYIFGVPQLFDALASNSIFIRYVEYSEDTVNEQDVRDILRLIPMSKHRSAGSLNHRQFVSPFVIAIVNHNDCSLAILDLLVKAGLNFENQTYCVGRRSVRADEDDAFHSPTIYFERIQYLQKAIQQLAIKKKEALLRIIQITRILMVPRTIQQPTETDFISHHFILFLECVRMNQHHESYQQVLSLVSQIESLTLEDLKSNVESTNKTEMQKEIGQQLKRQANVERELVDFLKSLPRFLSVQQVNQLVEPTLETFVMTTSTTTSTTGIDQPYSQALKHGVSTLSPRLVKLLLDRGAHWTLVFGALNRLTTTLQQEQQQKTSSSIYETACVETIVAMLLYHYYCNSPTTIETDPFKALVSTMIQGKLGSNVMVMVPGWTHATYRFVHQHRQSLYTLLMYFSCL